MDPKRVQSIETTTRPELRTWRRTPSESALHAALWDPHRVDDAVNYTWRQGLPMARYMNPNRWQEQVGSDV